MREDDRPENDVNEGYSDTTVVETEHEQHSSGVSSSSDFVEGDETRVHMSKQDLVMVDRE